MDTLSRDSSSTSNIMPMAGVILGAIALLLGIFTMVKATKVEKAVTAQGDEIAKIATLESEVRSSAAKSETDLRNLREAVQKAFNDVTTTFGDVNAKIAKMEEAMKKPAPAPAAAKGGAAAAPTGVLNADGTYTVAAGDNLTRIAAKFGARVDSILAENPGLEPTRLRVGQKIRIPRR